MKAMIGLLLMTGIAVADESTHYLSCDVIKLAPGPGEAGCSLSKLNRVFCRDCDGNVIELQVVHVTPPSPPAPAPAPPPKSTADGRNACFANLCGMDSACWCHEAGKERRCWSQPDDCEVDRSCCASTHSCKSTPYASETCGSQTVAARKKRDAEKRKP